MSYRFVKAAHYTVGRKAMKAIVVHFAEGGGTVEWQANPDSPTSSHYVVRYTGEVVQQVREADSAWSINPRLLRTNNDSAFTYLGERIVFGVTAAKACLGAYWYDPNAAVIAIEVEGYAANGLNRAQSDALDRLIRDIRTRHPKLPVLGHRDLQNYKPCPGKLIPWAMYGGHAVAAASAPTTPPDTSTAGGTVQSFAISTTPKLVNIRSGAWLYDNDATNPSSGNIQLSPNRALKHIGRLGTGVVIVAYDNAPKAYFVKSADVVSIVNAPAPVDTTPYSQSDVDAKVASATADKDATITALKEEVAGKTAALTAAEAAEKAAEDALAAAKERLTLADTLTSNLRSFLGL